MEYVEFLYYLKKDGYNDYLTSDTSPTRWDIKGTFEANSPSSFVQYRIRTPRRHQFGLSWTMGKAAVLSVDYGRSDYGTATFTSNDFFEEERIPPGLVEDHRAEAHGQ